jgi:hypothetical protein
LTANITPAPLTVTGINASDKVYDQTTTAVLNTNSATLVGVFNGDTVTLNAAGATGTFASQDVGSGITVTVAGLILSGAQAGDYSLTQPTTSANITPAPLTVTGITAGNKVYDRTTTAALNTNSATLVGVFNGDTVTLNAAGATGTFASKDVGSGITVTVAGLTLSGAQAGDYSLTQPVLTANITPAPLTITANSQSKVFGAAIPTLTLTYSGFVPGDSPASLTTQPILSTAATPTSPAGQYPIQVSGATSPDYAITFHSGTLTIAAAGSSITLTTPSGTSVFGQATTFTVQVNPVSPGAGIPTGVVTFFVDGSAFGSAGVNPLTGQATFNTAAIGVGAHTITAAFSGSSNFLASQSGSISQVVDQAGTQVILTSHAVRNRRGRITSVILTTQVQVIAPGNGVPTGPVTYFINGRSLATRSLGNAEVSLTISAKKAMKKTFYVTYGGDGHFVGSRSSNVAVTTKALKASVRPFVAFFARRRGHTPA